MSIVFNADEILTMAEQIERNGARFYRRAAEIIKNPESHKLFLELAAMEDDHEKVFSHMRAEIAKQKTRGVDFDSQDQAPLYLKAWADKNVFNVESDPVEQLTGQETMEDILNMAIGSEKESIVFYLGFKEALANKSDREKVEKILKEEMSHIASLSAKLAEIMN
ncbi:MAG: ferritin family protein [Proteobacteria bacterium]|nr:ferritin family protein [Pseudomonadota bacterium]